MASGDPTSRNVIYRDPRVNPAIPDSIGALLAEEWTVTPRSTLPSFLEHMMMEEARKSGWETLRSIFGLLEERLNRIVMDDERQAINATNNVGGAEQIRRLYYTLFRRWPIRVAKAFLQKLLQPFQAEIRFLFLYAVERGSLMHSKASISEALYGGKRVKLEESNTSNQYERSLRPIEKQDSVRLAFFLAFGPYLEERSKFFFRYFLKLCSSSFHSRASTATSTRKKTLQTILKIVWPLLRLTTKGTFLWYRWRYLLGRSVFFDPYSSLLNLVVRRTTMEDQQQQENEPQTAKGEKIDVANPNTIRMANIRENASEVIRSGGMWCATGGLASFFIALAWAARIRYIRQELQQERELHELRQVQQRRQQRRRPHQAENSTDDDDENDRLFKKGPLNTLLPSPPRSVLSCRRNSKNSFSSFGNPNNPTDHNSGVCPLCNEPRIHPTVSTSGHVFCLKCILAFLRENDAVCPVTRKPCPESSLVRLYEPTHRT